MIIKEKQKRKRTIKNIFKNNHIIKNNSYKNKEPAFQTNKTLQKYIYDKLHMNNCNQILDDKEKEINKQYKIEVHKNINYSKSYKQFSSISSEDNNNNFVYYKKHSRILSFLKSIEKNNINNNNNIFNDNKTHFSAINTINNKFNEILFNNNNNNSSCNTNRSNNLINQYNDNIFKENINHKYSNSTLSSTISYKEINNNNQLFSHKHVSSTISQEKIKLCHSSRFPYRRVGNVINRSDCQFTKNKKKPNFDVKNKLLNKCKSVKYFNNYTNINNEENPNICNKQNDNMTINTIKELEEQNNYLKRMIKISEKKLNVRQNQLKNLLIFQNQKEDCCFSSKNSQFKKIYSFTPMSSNQIKGNCNKENITKNIYNFNKQNMHKKVLIYDYFEEPLEQIPPKPFVLEN